MIQDAKAFGMELPPEKLRVRNYAVWPENLQAVELFLRCATQWRMGEPSAVAPAGVSGLDYAVVLSLGSLYLPASASMQTILEEVQTMERRALELIYEAAERQRAS